MDLFQPPWKPSRLWQPTDAAAMSALPTSRLLPPPTKRGEDAAYVSTRTFYAGIRPRGVLSGLFVITTSSEPVQFQGTSVRLRLNDSFYDHGVTVFLAYEHKDQIVLEDVLVWKGKELWSSEVFKTRWSYFNEFLKEWMPDQELQEKQISIAKYTSLHKMKQPGEGELLELIPNQSRQKRLIVMLEAEKLPASVTWIAIRETARGPDVYSVKQSHKAESEGIACVQSLAVSRALRIKTIDSFPVTCTWHERFKKWEITEVL